MNSVKSRFFSARLLSIFGLIFFLGACSTAPEKKGDEAESAYNLAKEYEKDERYEEAIRHFQDIKNKYPYSKYAALSELAIADTYYKQESYAEAQVAYQNFKDLHPKHVQIDYVTFKLGVSYYNQLPPTSDRDLTLATSALQNFDDVLHLFPSSEYVKESQEKKLATLKMLAEKEVYIADFYFKKQQYSAAMVRYEGGIRKYPGHGFDAKSLSRAAICAARLADYDKARTYLAELKQRFPEEGNEIHSAEKELK